MSRLLIVEDNPEYRKGARDFFDSISVSPVYATDYNSAIENLPADAAMNDCFFPKETGSGDISLGKEVIDRMAQSDPREMRVRRAYEVLSPFADVNDPELRKYVRFFVNRIQGEMSEDPVLMAIKQVSEVDKGIATLAAKNTLGLMYREKDDRDYYGALTKAMDESEANQPLGIKVAERATELKIPLVLVTSTYHHDILTQPVQDYAGRRGWRLIDCFQNQDEKATPEFWQRAYDALTARV